MSLSEELSLSYPQGSLRRTGNVVVVLFFALFVFSACEKEDKSLTPGRQGSFGKIGGRQVYPHSEIFKKTAEHGKTYMLGNQSCQTCHGQDLSGGTARVSCTSCHQGFPHSQEFKTTLIHGESFLANRQSCTTCHGKDLGGGAAKVACQTCHTYPHDKKWALPTRHGAAFSEISRGQMDIENPLERDYGKCLKCHENKPNEPSSFGRRHPEHFVACNSCHADMPHGQNFRKDDGEGTMRHFRFVTNNPERIGSCFSCHLNPNRNVPKIDLCMSCHEKEPEAHFPVIQFGKEK